MCIGIDLRERELETPHFSRTTAGMAKKTSKVRLQKELKAFVADPPPYIPRVHVNERNILVRAPRDRYRP